jgi:DNA polymerase III epsilon subunit-like protein
MSKTQKLFWFDVETTGIDNIQHEIIELSAIVEVSGEVKDRRSWFPSITRPETANPDAMKVNGVSVEEVMARELTQEKMIQEICQWLAQWVNPKDKWDFYTPAGHNVAFDVGFLKKAFEDQFGVEKGNARFSAFFDYHNLDTSIFGIMAHYMNPNWSAPFYGLGKTAAAFGIERDEEKEHGAEYDIELTRNLFRKAIGANEAKVDEE